MSLNLNEFVKQIFTANHDTITLSIMLVRTLIVYAFGIGIILQHKRFLGFSSSFDIIVRIMIGSLLANAIGGSFPFLPTLASVISLVTINWLISVVAWRFPLVEKYIKGTAVVLFENGKFNTSAMRKHAITQEDIRKVLREREHCEALSNIQKIVLENSGKLSFVDCSNS